MKWYCQKCIMLLLAVRRIPFMDFSAAVPTTTTKYKKNYLKIIRNWINFGSDILRIEGNPHSYWSYKEKNIYICKWFNFFFNSNIWIWNNDFLTVKVLCINISPAIAGVKRVLNYCYKHFFITKQSTFRHWCHLQVLVTNNTLQA